MARDALLWNWTKDCNWTCAETGYTKQLARAKQTDLAFKARGCVINRGRWQQTEHLLSFCKTLLLPAFSPDERQTNNSAGPGTGVGDEHGLSWFVPSLTRDFFPGCTDGDVSYTTCLGFATGSEHDAGIGSSRACVRCTRQSVKIWMGFLVCLWNDECLVLLLLNRSNPHPAKWRHFTRTHVYTQLFFASLGLTATNKQEKFTFPKAAGSGPQNKTDKSDCGISTCHWARAGGGKGKWRAEERKRERKIARVCLWEVSCGCPFIDLIYSEDKCVFVVGVECTEDCTIPVLPFSHIPPLEYSTCWQQRRMRLEGGRCFSVSLLQACGQWCIGQGNENMSEVSCSLQPALLLNSCPPAWPDLISRFHTRRSFWL